MSTLELRNLLIEKIQNTDNESLLREVYRLLELESENFEVFKFSDDQKDAINEARKQIKNGQFLTNDQADKEIDEWLCK